jgi:hypothetical protein
MSPVHAGVRPIRRDAGKTSASLACVLTTSSGTSRMRARLIGRPSHPPAVAAAVTDRAGVVHIWAIRRDLLEAGVTAPASRPACGDRIWLWTCEGRAGRSLMVARASPSFEVLELNCAGVSAFLSGRGRAEETVMVRRLLTPSEGTGDHHDRADPDRHP